MADRINALRSSVPIALRSLIAPVQDLQAEILSLGKTSCGPNRSWQTVEFVERFSGSLPPLGAEIFTGGDQPPDRVSEIRSQLLNAGLVTSEIVVVWAKSQQRVARVADRDVLNQICAAGLKRACGRTIADENIEEALTITPLGSQLLAKSR